MLFKEIFIALAEKIFEFFSRIDTTLQSISSSLAIDLLEENPINWDDCLSIITDSLSAFFLILATMNINITFDDNEISQQYTLNSFLTSISTSLESISLAPVIDLINSIPLEQIRHDLLNVVKNFLSEFFPQYLLITISSILYTENVENGLFDEAIDQITNIGTNLIEIFYQIGYDSILTALQSEHDGLLTFFIRLWIFILAKFSQPSRCFNRFSFAAFTRSVYKPCS